MGYLAGSISVALNVVRWGLLSIYVNLGFRSGLSLSFQKSSVGLTFPVDHLDSYANLLNDPLTLAYLGRM